MSGGSVRPVSRRISRKKRRLTRLFPSQDSSDRITNQLMHVPDTYDPDGEDLKTILLYNGAGAWNVQLGREQFLQARCPVDRCRLSVNRDKAQQADAILYKDHFTHPGFRRSPEQIWIMYFLECPYHTQHINFPDVFNWTATYRYDSDIVAPYEHWEYYDPRVKQVKHMERNYAAIKTKAVAWFVSNCGARNGRLQYAHELQKYIQVDIYGACGTMKCSRANAERCFELLDRDYKFYLAFENSNCKDYITEKFFVNGLGRDILPIVMGARPEDYERAAPMHSYIHVDDFEGPRQLAEYLHRLDRDDAMYNEYFRWKGTGELINTYFWCRMCAMLHAEPRQYKSYSDINDWWRGRGICTLNSWRNRDHHAHSNKARSNSLQN
ncbi:glycoprotein 3-alpha-L-fucosyltransferase A [Ctenocephalides felis]|uniref:glycoprotein 3-alpha-L-fucosyltransferase A n=1 Tax=Ctenocephalides felis TaxID=7515 RepID=UPI000E6E1C48|nr:glycoprotein 3-alpha-L-fucosyltransferase A [Ctenocephalides felis]